MNTRTANLLTHMGRFRSLLYRVASLMGWINATLRGKLIQRLVRVFLWRKAGGLINSIGKGR